MSKHTPGPWFYRLVKNPVCGGVVANRPISEIGGIGVPGEFVATFVSPIDGPLIAAAPEMRTALEAVERLLTRETPYGAEELTVLLSIVQAALAKTEDQ